MADKTWTRRAVLASLAASLTAPALVRTSFAATTGTRRLVLVILRGGLDGLSLLPPHGDPDYGSARGKRALTDAIDLDGTFGLHPSMAALKPLWDAGELMPLHAVGLPYQGRSHFDAQDLLENGTPTPHGARDGWLNRGLGPLGGEALAVGKGVPLVLRGAHSVGAVDPNSDADPGDAFLDQVEQLYGSDPMFAEALVEGRTSRDMLPATQGGGRRPGIGPAVGATATALSQPDGPSIAVLEAGGWDTHAGQDGGLERRLTDLATGLAALRDGLGEAWRDTAVLCVTEFGRTVRANGTGGTDHGTGGAALLLGGAVAGGRVHADWPGLGRDQLHEGRDLRVTTDLRAVFKAVLRDHLGLPAERLGEVFPDSAGAPAIGGLFA